VPAVNGNGRVWEHVGGEAGRTRSGVVAVVGRRRDRDRLRRRNDSERPGVQIEWNEVANPGAGGGGMLDQHLQVRRGHAVGDGVSKVFQRPSNSRP